MVSPLWIKNVRQAQTHGFVDTHAADIGVDAKALPHRVAAPDEADVAALLRRAAQMAEPRLADDTALRILERHPVENRLIDRQPGQLDPRGEVATLIGQRRHHTAWLGEHAACVPLDNHARRPVATTPDDRLVAEHIAGLHAIHHLRTILHRGDDCRRNTW